MKFSFPLTLGISLVAAVLFGCSGIAKTSQATALEPASSNLSLPVNNKMGEINNKPKVNYVAPYTGPDEDGAELWLRFPEVPVSALLDNYILATKYVVAQSNSATTTIAKTELINGIKGLTGKTPQDSKSINAAGSIIIGTIKDTAVKQLSLKTDIGALGAEGYAVEATTINGKSVIAIVGNTDVATLYGTYAFLRHLQSHQPINELLLTTSPKISHRILNHWDNLDRTVERGYAGESLWNWEELPSRLSPKYKDYARANAAIGINGTVLTNVNANAQVLTTPYLNKVKALADVFRPYGIKVYLTARFSAPIEIGGLKTADPLHKDVKQWWANKAEEIYGLIPDFGGFLVKANSEGQPGPQDYHRSHAEGANTLADAVAPHGGIIMWRAFVYASSSSKDRVREAYDEFQPLDGAFKSNVFVQPKNGALDFQPREPYHPLFGAMPKTPLALELQITKEYLGQDTHLAYLGPLYEEVLHEDTYANGPGTTVAHIIDGSADNHQNSAIAGVANIGSDTNWTGSDFNQANWYVFGRMAWNPEISAEAVAEEWVRQNFSNDPLVLKPVVNMMMRSREALVDYMTPLGLVHIMANDHHYGPGAWSNNLPRPEWNPTYYHKANDKGIGFDRTASGSDAVAQYPLPVKSLYENRNTVPDELLLFFHHVGWNERLASGRTLWQELVYRYSHGVDEVQAMREQWNSVEQRVDKKRFKAVADFLEIQHYEARWWRDASLAYFASVAKLAIPSGYAQLGHTLNYYQELNCPPNVTKPRCEQVYKGSPSPATLRAH